MKTGILVGIIGAIIFIVGFFGKIGSWFTNSPYGDLYTAMIIIGVLLVGAVKFVNWIQR